MGVDCCDASRLPTAKLIQEPNRVTLPNGQWKAISIKHPSVVVAISSSAVIYAYPDGSHDTARSEHYASVAGRLYLHAPGDWMLYNNTGSAQDVVIFDAYDAAAALQQIVQRMAISGSGGVADVRNADADADFAAALLGIVANARGSSFDVNADWIRNPASALNRIHVDLSAGLPVPASIAIAVAENFGSTAFGKIKQGSFDSDFNAFDAATAGLQVNSRLGAIDVAGSVRRICAVPISAGTPSGDQNGLLVTGLGARHYATLRRGKRWIAGSGRNVAVAGTNGYVATSPSILVIPNTGERVVLDRLKISWQDLTGVTGPLAVYVVLDPDDRWSSGGTARTPVNPGASHTVTFVPERCVDGAIVATAEDGDERDLFSTHRINITNPDDVDYDFFGGIELYENTTLLVYVTCGGGTAPDFTWSLEGWEDS